MLEKKSLVLNAVIDYVHDGDTPIMSTVFFGLGVALFNQRVRVLRINAPEMSTPDGAKALAFIQSFVKTGDKVVLTSPGPYGRRDNYGRILADITLTDGSDWATRMLAANHAVEMK